MRLISVFLTLALTYLSFAAAGRHPKPSPVAAPLAAAAPIQPVIAVFTGPPCSVAGIDLAACGSPNNLATCGVTCNGTVCLGSVNCGDPNALETCGVECINGRCANVGPNDGFLGSSLSNFVLLVDALQALNCAALGGECRNGTCSVCGTSADCRGNPEALETCGLNCNAGVCESVNCGNPNNDTTCGVTCTQGDNGLFQCLNALDCTGIQGGTFRCQQQTCVLVSGQTQPPTTPAPITIAPAAPVATQPSGSTYHRLVGCGYLDSPKC
jgi:hypothetical protein